MFVGVPLVLLAIAALVAYGIYCVYDAMMLSRAAHREPNSDVIIFPAKQQLPMHKSDRNAA